MSLTCGPCRCCPARAGRRRTDREGRAGFRLELERARQGDHEAGDGILVPLVRSARARLLKTSSPTGIGCPTESPRIPPASSIEPSSERVTILAGPHPHTANHHHPHPLVPIFPGRPAFGFPPLPSGLLESPACGKALQIARRVLTMPLPQWDQSPGEQKANDVLMPSGPHPAILFAIRMPASSASFRRPVQPSVLLPYDMLLRRSNGPPSGCSAWHSPSHFPREPDGRLLLRENVHVYSHPDRSGCRLKQYGCRQQDGAHGPCSRCRHA